jgi:hypothetical protein
LAGLELCQFSTTVNCRTTDAHGVASLQMRDGASMLWVGDLEGSRFMVQLTGPTLDANMAAPPLTVLDGNMLASMRRTAGTKPRSSSPPSSSRCTTARDRREPDSMSRSIYSRRAYSRRA